MKSLDRVSTTPTTLVTERIAQKQLGDAPWIAFPGGELEGRPPKAMCRACRERANATGTLCFQCYRASLDRDRALAAAASLDTASDARFQTTLPFEAVDPVRLDRLRRERLIARRVALQTRQGSLTDRLRRAQMAARRAIQRIVATSTAQRTIENAHSLEAATHAAELQLPESWLPFVVAR